ncbi:PREDICTED: histamine H2 receptor-like [Nicrophorus vespilloides]|uniref:Histamine H2 receptor-like n=1 Tax=Nicrophorus vespilloides TaxID=110193 RepID=A0ABM1M860_NICVS|nr:PREDICTED: histamine H2 receptor-like [Nicrophorus vespilloides]
MTSLWLTIPLVFISIFGIVVNTYILLVVSFSRQATTANNLLLLHLGALNVALGILFLLFAVPGLSNYEWLSSGAPCLLHGFFFTILHPLVLWTICGLNADRYYAIAAPLHYGHLVNPKKVLLCLGVGWVIALSLSVPPYFTIAPYTFNKALGACVPDFSSGQGAIWYSAAFTAFTLLLPITLIICCNIKILMIARYHRHRIASAIYEVTLSAQVTITHQRNPFFVPTVTAPSAGGPKFRSRSPISTVLQLLGSFLILYLPYYTIILWESSITFLVNSNTSETHPSFYRIVLVLLTCSPSINGFLYGLKNKMLRKTFQNYWRKKLTKSEVNHEIQARTPSTCGSRRQSLTPLGFFTRPSIPRRLSEAFLDPHKVSSPSKPKMKRIASELTWRPSSANGLHFTDEKRIPQASSCNTLQIPRHDDIDDFQKLNNKPTVSTANLLLQKFFGLENDKKVIETEPEVTPKKSPRILITRALSEDSDKTHSNVNTPSKRISNSSTNLLEKKWRQIKYKDSEYDSDGPNSKCKPLLDRSSDSSEASEGSSGLYMNLDDQALIGWPNSENSEMWSKEDEFVNCINVQSEIVL